MKNIMVNVENPFDLLAEVSFLNGFLNAIGKEYPDMIEINKVVEQLVSKKK